MKTFTNTLPLCSHPSKTFSWGREGGIRISLHSELQFINNPFEDDGCRYLHMNHVELSHSLDQELEGVPPAEEYDLVY